MVDVGVAFIPSREAAELSLWRTLAQSEVAYCNVYGPTETTVNAAVGRIAGDQPFLGLALPNTRLYILDQGRRPVPAGVVGEIHVAGAGVGRGYLNRPQLTEQKFSTNPFAPDDAVYGRMSPAEESPAVDAESALGEHWSAAPADQCCRPGARGWQ